MPFSNFGTNELPLPKSDQESRACMWPWLTNQSLASAFQGKRRPFCRNCTLDLSVSRKETSEAFDVSLANRLTPRNYWFNDSAKQASNLLLNAGAKWCRSWEIQGYRDSWVVMPQKHQILGVDTVTAVTNHGSECTIITLTDHSPFETAVLSITHLDVGLNLECAPKNQAIFWREPFVLNPRAKRLFEAHLWSGYARKRTKTCCA